MTTYYDTFPSPLGVITASTNGAHITSLHIEGDRYFTTVPPTWSHTPDLPLLRRLQVELSGYFEGMRTKFDVPIDFRGTPFQQTVWSALLSVPTGHTTTYRAIAEAIGKPNAVRAVGTAIGRNPICIVVPCHRVTASNGGLGGYVAGLSAKEYLLKLEQT